MPAFVALLPAINAARNINTVTRLAAMANAITKP